jgi:hypothetical protein
MRGLTGRERGLWYNPSHDEDVEKSSCSGEAVPEADQEIIGRHVLAYIEKLRALRADIDAGVRSLDAGKGTEVDMRDVVSSVHTRHEKGR